MGIDHDDFRTRNGKQCYGLMSTGDRRPAIFSDCNKEEFEEWIAQGDCIN